MAPDVAAHGERKGAYGDNVKTTDRVAIGAGGSHVIAREVTRSVAGQGCARRRLLRPEQGCRRGRDRGDPRALAALRLRFEATSLTSSMWSGCSRRRRGVRWVDVVVHVVEHLVVDQDRDDDLELFDAPLRTNGGAIVNLAISDVSPTSQPMRRPRRQEARWRRSLESSSARSEVATSPSTPSRSRGSSRHRRRRRQRRCIPRQRDRSPCQLSSGTGEGPLVTSDQGHDCVSRRSGPPGLMRARCCGRGPVRRGAGPCCPPAHAVVLAHELVQAAILAQIGGLRFLRLHDVPTTPAASTRSSTAAGTTSRAPRHGKRRSSSASAWTPALGSDRPIG